MGKGMVEGEYIMQGFEGHLKNFSFYSEIRNDWLYLNMGMM